MEQTKRIEQHSIFLADKSSVLVAFGGENCVEFCRGSCEENSGGFSATHRQLDTEESSFQ